MFNLDLQKAEEPEVKLPTKKLENSRKTSASDSLTTLKPFIVSGKKTDFSSPVATDEFSKFVHILSAALSQHHLSGFEIAPLEFHHLH